jgi:hypothetical protein
MILRNVCVLHKSIVDNNDLFRTPFDGLTDLVSLNHENHFVSCTDIAIISQVHLAANHYNFMRHCLENLTVLVQCSVLRSIAVIDLITC